MTAVGIGNNADIKTVNVYDWSYNNKSTMMPEYHIQFWYVSKKLQHESEPGVDILTSWLQTCTSHSALCIICVLQ